MRRWLTCIVPVINGVQRNFLPEKCEKLFLIVYYGKYYVERYVQAWCHGVEISFMSDGYTKYLADIF